MGYQSESTKKILIVIPARGGSKRIINKNMRILCGKPLIFYALNIATSVDFDADIVISTDSEDIAEYAINNYKVLIRLRPENLALDSVTLDPVVYDAMLFSEEKKGTKYDYVITLQPTSPTLRASTLNNAISLLIDKNADTCISVTDDTHLFWGESGENGELVPLYKERLNSQWLPRIYRETGAFLISKRDVITETSRIGKNVIVFPLRKEEAIDIDDEIDWLMAKALLERLSIMFVVKGGTKIGTGHVYRTLAIADTFFGNDISFVVVSSPKFISSIIRQKGYQVVEVGNVSKISALVDELKPNIIINDILDTRSDYINSLKRYNTFVVNFEDLGSGSQVADLVFNALYEFSNPPAHHLYGSRYVCLSQPFLISNPSPFNEEAKTLLVTFGGTDENNITLSVCKIIPRIIEATTIERIIIVLGLGYKHNSDLQLCLDKLDRNIRERVYIYRNVDNMAKIMKSADIAITSNGRTVYELASLGVPGISIAQNNRETMHLFARYSEGFRYLGIASTVSAVSIFRAVEEIANNVKLRRRMRDALIKADIKNGIYRVHDEILSRYRRWLDEKGAYRKSRHF